MAKLVGFETEIVRQGIKLYADLLKADISKATKQGKNHLFTEGYVDLLVKEIEYKLKL